jgi:hypothetical protein
MTGSLGSSAADNCVADLAVESEYPLDPVIAALKRFGTTKAPKEKIQNCIKVNIRLIAEVKSKIKNRRSALNRSRWNSDGKLKALLDDLSYHESNLKKNQNDLAR